MRHCKNDDKIGTFSMSMSRKCVLLYTIWFMCLKYDSWSNENDHVQWHVNRAPAAAQTEINQISKSLSDFYQVSMKVW